MRVESLTSQADGTVSAVIVGTDGDRVRVNFSVTRHAGITVANPDVPIFDRSALDAAGVRAVVAAVVAFHRVASQSSASQPDG